jgi:hypothetical protein
VPPPFSCSLVAAIASIEHSIFFKLNTTGFHRKSQDFSKGSYGDRVTKPVIQLLAWPSIKVHTPSKEKAGYPGMMSSAV